MSKSESTFKEKMETFFSYLRLLAFASIVGAIGYWYYHYQAEQKVLKSLDQTVSGAVLSPIEPETVRKPSDLWKPVVAVMLPVFSAPISQEATELPPLFARAESVTNQNVIVAGSMQPAWQIAQQLSKQLRESYKDRQSFAQNTNLRSTPPPVSKTKVSAAQLAEDEKRKEFFAQSVNKRWDSQVAQRKTQINALYQQLLAQEAKLAL